MVERIGSREARRNFADLLGRIRYGGEVIILERSGSPMAAMVPIELIEQVLAELGARFEVVDRIRERTTGYSEEGITRDVDEAVAEVREAAHERDTCTQDRG
jgi:prevent-host-death family protein